MPEDPVLARLEPEAVLPDQVSSGSRRDADVSGSRALMLAVLADAIRCLEDRRQSVRRARLADEASRWIESHDRRWPFSFVNVCEALGFEAEALRRRLRADACSTLLPRRLAGQPGNRNPRPFPPPAGCPAAVRR